MEKATGELSLTVITVIAIAAIAGLVVILLPRMGDWVQDTFEDTTGQIDNIDMTQRQ